MPRSAKLFFGFFVLWATIYAMAALFGDYALTGSVGADREASRFFDHVFIYLNAAVATGVLMIEVYLALSLGSLRVADRILWAFGLMFFFPVTAPAFWYLHIWRQPRHPAAR